MLFVSETVEPSSGTGWYGARKIVEAPNGQRYSVVAEVRGIGHASARQVEGKYEVWVEKFPRGISRRLQWRHLSSRAAQVLHERTVNEIEEGTWPHLPRR